jgi:protein required for attachment to host cells
MAKARKRIAAVIGNPGDKPTQRVLVADGGTARLLRVTGRKGAESLTELDRLELPSAHLFAREMVSDRTGRVFDSGSRTGSGPKSVARHGAASDFDPHAADSERFAKRIARRLDTERRNGVTGGIVIIAAPHFLGVLRPQLSGPTRKQVVREIAKDLVRATDAQILRSALT